MNESVIKSANNHRKTVGEWLSFPWVWRIPVYQRHYAWDTTPSGPIELLWETIETQIIERLEGRMPSRHYFGAILVDDKTDRSNPAEPTRYDIVDGQQRITTIQIALLASIKSAEDHKNSYGREIKKKLEKYIFFDRQKNEPRLYPTNFDKKQFQGMIFNVYGDMITNSPSNSAAKKRFEDSKILDTLSFFERKYKNLIQEHHQYAPEQIINAVIETLTEGFDIVLIVLEENDQPQRIFESLNNFAKPLTTFDLIRNNVFDRASSEQQGNDEKLFNSDAWQELEKPYWGDKANQRKNERYAY